MHEHLAQLVTAPAPPEEVAAEARVVLERFEASPLAERLASVEVLGRELPILLSDDAGRLWRGSIDLLYRDADGTLVVADYKTDAELEGAMRRHQDQMRVYVEAVRRAVPGSRVRAELWMLRQSAILPGVD